MIVLHELLGVGIALQHFDVVLYVFGLVGNGQVHFTTAVAESEGVDAIAHACLDDEVVV